ncbi:putative nuclease HARBI1 [Lucilia cuprina]|nr:putative nuclease HARBI1 [Lucilia cuprina]
MAFQYIGMYLEDHFQHHIRSQERRILRNMEDPFDLSDREFVLLYRTDKSQMYDIIDSIQHRFTCNRITGISPEKQETPGTPRFRYNEALCKTRNCIERDFGVIKATWRCLSRHRTLQYKPAFAGKIVNACTGLHNIKRQNNNFSSNEFNDEVHFQSQDEFLEQNQSLLSVTRRIQNQIIEQYFS